MWRTSCGISHGGASERRRTSRTWCCICPQTHRSMSPARCWPQMGGDGRRFKRSERAVCAQAGRMVPIGMPVCDGRRTGLGGGKLFGQRKAARATENRPGWRKAVRTPENRPGRWKAARTTENRPGQRKAARAAESRPEHWKAGPGAGRPFGAQAEYYG